MTQETVREEKGFGAMLREARESLGISIGDVSSRTRLSVDQIRALEEENLERLPEPVYVRAFLRAYAKAIGIDDAPVVNDYVTRYDGGAVQIAQHTPTEDFREVAYYETPRPSRWKFVVLVLIVALVSVGIWGVYSGTFARLMQADGSEAAKVENGVSEIAPTMSAVPEAPKATTPVNLSETGLAQPPVSSQVPVDPNAEGEANAAKNAAETGTSNELSAPESQTPSEEKNDAPTPVSIPSTTNDTPSTNATLSAETNSDGYAAEFHASASCWVHVIAPDGRNLIAREMKPGETQSVALPAGTRVTVGNPPALVLTLDGHPYDLGSVTQRGVARFVIR